MTARTLAVVAAGLREPSSTRLLADRLAAAAAQALRDGGDEVALEVVDLREHAHDLVDALLTSFAPRRLQEVLDRVAAADGVIAVTPVFSGSYSGVFKTFFDVLEPGTLAGVPVLLGATAGTARHSLALEHAVRPLLSYLRALSVPTAVFAAPEDWGAAGAAEQRLAERIARAGGELAALIAGRPTRAPADGFADPVPFDQLLRGT